MVIFLGTSLYFRIYSVRSFVQLDCEWILLVSITFSKIIVYVSPYLKRTNLSLIFICFLKSFELSKSVYMVTLLIPHNDVLASFCLGYRTWSRSDSGPQRLYKIGNIPQIRTSSEIRQIVFRSCRFVATCWHSTRAESHLFYIWSGTTRPVC